MTTLAPVAAPSAAYTANDEQNRRAPVAYGAAVTHRDFVREKMRVDPVSLAAKKGAHTQLRQSDPPPDKPEHRGQYVDIEV